jgi:hypothetical protein
MIDWSHTDNSGKGKAARKRYRRVRWSLRGSVQESHRQMVVKSKVISNLGGTTYNKAKYLYYLGSVHRPCLYLFSKVQAVSARSMHNDKSQ